MAKQAFSLWQCIVAKFKSPLTTCGYGIHSPFLYHLVTEVLDPHYDFYRMAELEHLYPYATYEQLKAAWVLYRLAVFYPIERIEIGNGLPTTLQKMADYLNSNTLKGVAGPFPKECPTQVVVEKGRTDTNAAENMILMLTDTTLRKTCRIAEERGYRTILHLSHISLLFGNPFLPTKVYLMSLSL